MPGKETEVLGFSKATKGRHVEDMKKLEEAVKALRAIGARIVLTQGVYDLIHEGHARYLEMAKSFGDTLIVGVDSDELTRERKGPNRPIVPERERIEMLSHLRHVDLVVVRQSNEDIGALIRAVKPDVLITSKSTKDFTDKMKKEYNDYCGKIITLPPQATTSTSARIRDLTIEGAEQLANQVNDLTRKFIKKIRQS